MPSGRLRWPPMKPAESMRELSTPRWPSGGLARPLSVSLAVRCSAYDKTMARRSATTSDGGPTWTELAARRDEIAQVAARYGASNVRVFGSVARATARSDSDIDLLVDFEPGRTLVDQVGLWQDLEALLGRSVDVVSWGGLTDRDDDIRSEALAL